jgi:hypothetical protein
MRKSEFEQRKAYLEKWYKYSQKGNSVSLKSD